MANNHFERYRNELDKLNLKTKEDLENLVKPLIKDATKLVLKKTPIIPENSHLISQFGGQPYFEKDEQWPVAKNGNILDFVFQIFNEDGIKLPEHIKLIQFYYDFDENPWGTEDDGWLVKIYENIDKDNSIIIEIPEVHGIVNYCEIEYETIKSLPDWEGISSFDVNASKLSCILDEDKPWENYYKTVEKLIGEDDMHSQLGGYAKWVQGGQERNKDFVLLFQIDSEGDAGLHWSDCGMVYAFYNEHKKVEFELQCY